MAFVGRRVLHTLEIRDEGTSMQRMCAQCAWACSCVHVRPSQKSPGSLVIDAAVCVRVGHVRDLRVQLLGKDWRRSTCTQPTYPSYDTR